MAIAERDVILDLVLQPVFWQDPPAIQILFNDRVLHQDLCDSESEFSWTLPALDHNKLSVFFLNKRESDHRDGQDKAVIIKRIGVEKFFYDSFMRHTRYRPEYSAGYYQYALDRGISVEPIIHSNYLGFNGEWWLEFTWPTFSWIYSLETNNQGWVYEKNI